MLHAGDIDIAVHSMKDMPDTLPEGMVINCILEREDPRDAFISLKAKTIMDLLEGAVIGTSSVRRQSQLLASRPDLNIVPFRGNVQTRLRKLEDGEVDATILAVAGLKRLDMTSKITSAVDTNVMLPAVAQGAIGVECLEKNHHILEVLDCINHTPSFTRVAAERSFLKMLDGSCTTPLGALATITKDGSLYFEGLLANPDGSIIYRVERKGIQADAIAIGEDAGQEVRTNAGHLLGCN